MKVGIKDVAKAAGVSPATVSRALAGKAIDPEMRSRVEEAVRRTGYLPNLAARRLRSRHSNTIGLIVADIRNPFFTAISRSVEDLAYARGLRVILCNTDENPEKEEMYLRLMEEERVLGAICAPTRRTAGQVGRVRRGFPIVMVNRAEQGQLHDCVVLDNAGASAALVEHLHRQGYRRIAGLFGAASATGAERRQGYESAMQRLGLPVRAAYVEHRAGDVDARLAELLAAPGRPDALIASNGLMLLDVIRALQRAGLVVPQDIALAGFDNEPWTEMVGGGITLIEQPVEEIGRSAMMLLLDRVENAAAPPRRIVLDGHCLERGSTPARRS